MTTKAAPLSTKEKIGNFIEAWFTSGKVDYRSEKQLEREKFYLGCIPFNRFMIAPFVLATQIAIGSLYSWSIFNKYMDTNVWGTPGTNANAFTVCVAFFGATTALMGNWIARNGPFACVLRTLILTPAGWGFACLGSYIKEPAIVFVGFGICHGIGAGLAYISTCSMTQKWFPEARGFATGIAVMGFGVGSFIWTTVGKELMDPLGKYKMVPYQVQGIFSVIFFGLLLISLPIMRDPPPGWTPPAINKKSEEELSKLGFFKRSGLKFLYSVTSPPKKSMVHNEPMTYIQAISSQEMRLMLILVFCQNIIGVVFLSSAADMTQNVFGFDANYGNFIASMQNLMNFTGRFGWGFITDKIGRKRFYLASLACQAFAAGLMAVWIEKQIFGLWCLSFLMIGSLYGGGFGVLPAFMAEMFGPKISAATHGTGIAVWAMATIIGVPVFGKITATYTTKVAGKVVPAPYAYMMNAYWLCGLPALGFLAMLLLNVRPEDRAIRKYFGGLRARFFSKVVVIRLVDKTEQQREWEIVQRETARLNASDDLAKAPELHYHPKEEVELKVVFDDKTGTANVAEIEPESAMSGITLDDSTPPVSPALTVSMPGSENASTPRENK